MEDKKILWYINCYDRIEMLKEQQNAIRNHFGKSIDILTSINLENEKRRESARHREDIFVHVKKNSGHHSGVRDAHNSIVPYLDDYDLIISSHADCLFTDYSMVEKIIEEMEKLECKHANLTDRKWVNGHRSQDGPVYRTFADFFILSAKVWKEIGVFEDNCDLDIGIECMFYLKITEVIGEDEVFRVPCELHLGGDCHVFKDVMGKTGDMILRDNNREKRNKYLKENYPEMFRVISL